ncbi:hypothetical protein KEM60_03124 [Austwickia sp. TVS 96-490-7B]|uniref:hypothetical protein n=1 Tax=Austwickia sp. TVS 96-490-7B TaxID=2830843 RepID=UPI001C595B11|nr:hypothetical protein [Austwickia sp. TVS 96-490-7B]MBW3086895.1 hypothetical protein [Austwickia sp. TVS 96-490-7B]
MTTIATRQQLSVVMLGSAALLLVWIPMLGVVLPAGADNDRWWQCWDLLELLALGVGGVLALRRSSSAVFFAVAAATLLLIDACVDVGTAWVDGSQLWRAVAMAAVAELPLTVLCVDLARQSAARYPAGRALLAI